MRGFRACRARGGVAAQQRAVDLLAEAARRQQRQRARPAPASASAISAAIAPPIEWPTKWALSTPRAVKVGENCAAPAPFRRPASGQVKRPAVARADHRRSSRQSPASRRRRSPATRHAIAAEAVQQRQAAWATRAGLVARRSRQLAGPPSPACRKRAQPTFRSGRADSWPSTKAAPDRRRISDDSGDDLVQQCGGAVGLVAVRPAPRACRAAR